MLLSIQWIKTGLVLFWSVWISIVFLTNLFEGLKQIRILPEGWKFASQNYALIQKTVGIYLPPAWLAKALFTGVVIWQAVAVLAYWSAFAGLFVAGTGNLAPVDTALALSLGLWAAFMVSDEIFRAYEQQSTHLMLFVAQLITLLAVHLLA